MPRHRPRCPAPTDEHPGHGRTPAPRANGATIATQITISGHIILWCPDGRGTATLCRAEDAGLHPTPLGELVTNSEVVLSICPPAVAEEIASTVAGLGYCGIYVEANAISPTRMHRITTRFTGAGTTVIDGSIFGSPPGGQSCVQALLTEAERMPRDILGNRDYLPSVATRAWRWVPEMHEVADTLLAQHLPPDLALATAEILRRWADTTTADQPTDLASILRQLHVPPHAASPVDVVD